MLLAKACLDGSSQSVTQKNEFSMMFIGLRYQAYSSTRGELPISIIRHKHDLDTSCCFEREATRLVGLMNLDCVQDVSVACFSIALSCWKDPGPGRVKNYGQYVLA